MGLVGKNLAATGQAATAASVDSLGRRFRSSVRPVATRLYVESYCASEGGWGVWSSSVIGREMAPSKTACKRLLE